MKYTRAQIDSIGYELAPVVVTSEELEDRLAPVYERLHLQTGQLEALTGIYERRWWEPDTPLSQGAAAAAHRALDEAGVAPHQVGALIYAGVCRDNFEPATACAVADSVGIRGSAGVYDISNACLGVMNGILDIANRIELGQIRCGLVVSAETAREIVDVTIERMLANPDYEHFTRCLATLTGGSGAVAVLMTDGSFGNSGHRLRGGVHLTEPQHHELCRWGLEGGVNLHRPTPLPQDMFTDSVSVLRHGVALGIRTWGALLSELSWTTDSVDRVICHQVGGPHRDTILESIEVPADKDFSTFPYLGNMGTVSLPVTAKLASEREALQPGQRVAFLGIGSGLNCLMLGWDW